MHPVGPVPSLTLSLIDGSGFAGALYLRDRFGLPLARHVPALTPPVRRAGPGTAVDTAGCDRWWDALVDSPESRPVKPPRGTAVAALYDEVEDELIRWVAAQEVTSGAAFATFRSSWTWDLLGRVRASGTHVTEVLPVGGAWSLSLAPRRLLVSVGTLADHDTMTTLLRTAVAALGHGRPT